MGMCWKCKQSIPNPRVARPEILKAELNNVSVRAWRWFKCPSCKLEWSSTFILEIITEDDTAPLKLPISFKQNGLDTRTLPQLRDPRIAKDPKRILSELLSESVRRITYIPDQGKRDTLSVSKMSSKKGDVGVVHGVSK